MKMPSTKLRYTAMSLAIVALLANGSVQAADTATEHASHAEHSPSDVIQGKGVVHSVDADANMITLAHEPNPAMTMQFKVLENAEEQVMAGDTVMFDLQGTGTDSTITKIQKAD